MYQSLESAVSAVKGQDVRILRKSPVSGGDINDAYMLALEDGDQLFMKSNTARMLPAFIAEEEGLAAIAGTGRIGSPKVLGIGTDPGGFSFLLQEPIVPGRKISGYWETFGRELCAMHRAPVPETSGAYRRGFGFPADNFIGAGNQINTWKSSWIDFFRECRLEPQLRSADHYLSSGDRRKALSVLDHLDEYLTEPAAPSLLHGDLWGGNFMTGPDGKAWLIDPAVYYGHPEADIAMTELFGGFAPAFYDAYFAEADLTPGYRDRRDLYNLYHLLNHLNLFGMGYLSSVRAIIGRYSK